MRAFGKISAKVILILSFSLLMAACEPGSYGTGGWQSPQSSYPGGGYYPAPGSYGGGYYPPPPPRYDNRYDDRRYDDRRYDDRRYDDRRYEDRDRHHNHDDRPAAPPPPAPSPPQPATIRPSCPSGTTFNGRHCMIDDKSKIRKGGKGTVNACPKGMRLSGDQCIDN